MVAVQLKRCNPQNKKPDMHHYMSGLIHLMQASGLVQYGNLDGMLHSLGMRLHKGLPFFIAVVGTGPVPRRTDVVAQGFA